MNTAPSTNNSLPSLLEHRKLGDGRYQGSMGEHCCLDTSDDLLKVSVIIFICNMMKTELLSAEVTSQGDGTTVSSLGRSRWAVSPRHAPPLAKGLSVHCFWAPRLTHLRNASFQTLLLKGDRVIFAVESAVLPPPSHHLRSRLKSECTKGAVNCRSSAACVSV